MHHMTACIVRATIWVVIISLWLAGCARNDYPLLPASNHYGSTIIDPDEFRYVIGPGDSLGIFVWRNPEVSQSVTVRPDGMITTPLVDDLPASGKTPTQLARDIEKALETYIRQPIVTVLVGGGSGPFNEQIRVVGEAARPQALAYIQRMTLLDLMIVVGGTTQYADGNNASILRMMHGQLTPFKVRIDDLLKDGDITANVDMLPGDILIIPESWF